MTFTINCPNCNHSLGVGYNNGNNLTISNLTVKSSPPQGPVSAPQVQAQVEKENTDIVNKKWVPEVLKSRKVKKND